MRALRNPKICKSGRMSDSDQSQSHGSDAVGDAGLKVIDAVRELMSTFGPDSVVNRPDPGQRPPSSLTEVTSAPTRATQYQSLAMLAATIRLLSHETGRDESTILDELAKNYR
jgi:hypothetical protein